MVVVAMVVVGVVVVVVTMVVVGVMVMVVVRVVTVVVAMVGVVVGVVMVVLLKGQVKHGNTLAAVLNALRLIDDRIDVKLREIRHERKQVNMSTACSKACWRRP